jgi:hypothetical protein
MVVFGNSGRRAAAAALLALSVSLVGATAALADTPPPSTSGCATTAGFPSLGAASGYAVLALNGLGTRQTATFSKDTVNGNVAIASGVTGSNMSPSTINGNVTVDLAGSFGGSGRVNGTVTTNQSLAAARSAALGASSQAAGLTPTFTFQGISSGTTITGGHGLTVVNINGDLNLSNASLILSSPYADAFFVVNVSGALNLVGSGGIVVAGAVPQSQLLVNMTGSGASLISTKVGNVVQGTLLAPKAGGNLDGTFGSILLGQNFSLLSGISVSFGGCHPGVPPIIIPITS